MACMNVYPYIITDVEKKVSSQHAPSSTLHISYILQTELFLVDQAFHCHAERGGYLTGCTGMESFKVLPEIKFAGETLVGGF